MAAWRSQYAPAAVALFFYRPILMPYRAPARRVDLIRTMPVFMPIMAAAMQRGGVSAVTPSSIAAYLWQQKISCALKQHNNIKQRRSALAPGA